MNNNRQKIVRIGTHWPLSPSRLITASDYDALKQHKVQVHAAPELYKKTALFVITNDTD